ncbi:N-acetyl-gamma-glutamyl-phosphate reductase [Agriterribacter sp.]|uniref:N-acetyl-gamma-glutamyl-phosphate reductase n=1 Tax=Agriterribacter sp. TaxID=2821509 RepID=UPI002BE5F07C|nr:N-acetyl-gamma-glutamyl-phosphate reductase [Agriterribacter sp.]HTN08691.1 N-acetyl-gamma-glutamyl-phosphate reductase [Agriterribacter sp.]
MKIKAGIIGGAGYTGGELIRLLLNHPDVDFSFIHSRSNANKPLYAVHEDLIGETDLAFSHDLTPVQSGELDILFLCLGHGESRKFLSENTVAGNTKIIDLANDFRLAAQSASGKRNFVYGLPEINKTAIQSAHDVANPGCFATAIQLGLLPLAKAGLLEEVYTTGITGSTGAGQSPSSTSHFSWRANNIQAYKTLTHQHLGEIVQSLMQVSPPGKQEQQLNFVPWRGDFTRGIFVSSTLHCERPYEELVKLYKAFYKEQLFTIVSDAPIFLKQVVNTNKCIIQLEKVGVKLVVHSITDNLLKGACGQAVQNMNLMFGLKEAAGLKLKAGYF